jgi:primosomal protein N' (replication factor Y)
LGIILNKVDKPAFETKPLGDLVDPNPLPPELLELHKWLESYYPAPHGLITQLFLPTSLTTARRTVDKISDKKRKALALPVPTPEQKAVIQAMKDSRGSFLLHGETSSGKTRVYQELAAQALANNKSALILTPEIGLTPQLAASFEATFPGQVITVHSAQTPASRRDSWAAIHSSTTPLIIIGPRSALFTPIKSLGVIIIDEAHDSAYKQEQMPYYQASRVAAKLADLHKAKLLLGSATPLIHDYYAFAAKHLPILRMTSSAMTITEEVTASVVDLKDRQNLSRSPWLSNDLIKEIKEALNDRQQSLLFLNRRGTARLVLCQNCGWQATCPRCDLPLTYHGDLHNLRCHTCGFTSTTPSGCPDCGGTDIQFKSVGTKTIVSEVNRLFPKARVQRFDSDTKKAERLEEHYDTVKNGEVDILVGTQMLSKGLDLPKLRVVGVIIADTSLYFPDFTAEERTFQMIRQVIGRVGRGHQKGVVVVQTYYPDSPTIKSAVTKDYDQFYKAQLSERELYRFPPYYFVLKVSLERASQPAVRKAAQDLAEAILNAGLSIELCGPTPAFTEKTHNKYRWQIIIKAKQRNELIKTIALLPKNCTYDIDPTNLL